jgi:hypothetical protein
MSLELAFNLLLAVTCVVGVIGVANAIRVKLREFEQREAHAAATRKGSYRPNPDRAARRRAKPA